MNNLLHRLQKIQKECLDGKENKIKAIEDEDLDEFSRLKLKIARDIRDIYIRELIKKRDELEKEAPRSVALVETSSQIRNMLKDVRADATKLDKVQKKEKETFIKKNKSNPEIEEQLDRREEMVQLVFDHVEECKLLDQKRHGLSMFGNSSSSSSSSSDPTISKLPDIDDPGFQLLIKNDQIIDGLLDNVAAGVHDLKNQAMQMGDEIELQGRILDDLDSKVDKVNTQLDNINVRLARALKSVRKGDRFIVDIILLIILLGLAGYIYKIFVAK